MTKKRFESIVKLKSEKKYWEERAKFNFYLYMKQTEKKYILKKHLHISLTNTQNSP